MNFVIKQAEEKDIPILIDFVKRLAEYEKLSKEMVATEGIYRDSFFGKEKFAHAVIGYYEDKPVGIAIYFFNFSTFIGRPGLYLEDLFVLPELRGKGFGKKLLIYLSKIAVEKRCGRMEWSVLDWNEPAIEFYKSLGAIPMDEWTVFRLTGDNLKKLAKAE